MRPVNHPSLLLSTTIVVLLTLSWAGLRIYLFEARQAVLLLTFVLPLLVCVWTGRKWQLWLMAAAFAAVAAFKALWLMPGHPIPGQSPTIFLASTLFNVVVGAVVIHWIISQQDWLETQNATIRSQNAELEAQAEELSQQNEEIRAQSEELAQQNEEVETQSEELQRQNEELQEANTRLSSREEMLQAVLQLARASGGGRQALEGICERALEIIGEPAEALAILDLDGSRGLRLRAHARRQGQPPLREHWPLEQSLAKVVLREDRTAYVDDLRRRPDLAVPFGDDSSVQSLLATPLRVAGDHAGVVVVCGRKPSHWTREQFRLIEWVAAQCGLIVEGLRWQEALEARAAEVEAANRAKDQFLAMLSHELRTPLTPVLAAAGALETDARLPEDARQDVSVIRRNVAVQSRLIDDLLDLTRVSRGKLELHRQDLGIATLLRETAAIVAADLDAREQTLTLQIDLPAGCTVSGDGPRLQQVFWNLLKNAIKFSPSRGRIMLSARRVEAVEPKVAVVVSDSGVGIDSADLETIFLPFEQASTGLPRGDGQGLGLGLCIAKAIVELHGGTIRASSEGIGHGASFVVELPLSAKAHLSDGASRSDSGTTEDRSVDLGRSAMRILLVEDHDDTGRLLARLLKNQGHAVQHARDIASALEFVQTGEFDLMISDLGLPDGSGLDLMRQIRSLRPVLPAVCLSGYGMDGDVRASIDAGFREHLTKPVDLQQLHAAIDRISRAPVQDSR